MPLYTTALASMRCAIKLFALFSILEFLLGFQNMPSPTNIAHNQIYSSLLQRGYFPEKIPPIFSTQDLMPALNVSQSHPFLTDKIANDSELLVHDAPNRGIRRRVFSVANPIWHARTANEIANGWNLIASKLNTGNISISRPIICANRAFK